MTCSIKHEHSVFARQCSIYNTLLDWATYTHVHFILLYKVIIKQAINNIQEYIIWVEVKQRLINILALVLTLNSDFQYIYIIKCISWSNFRSDDEVAGINMGMFHMCSWRLWLPWLFALSACQSSFFKQSILFLSMWWHSGKCFDFLFPLTSRFRSLKVAQSTLICLGVFGEKTNLFVAKKEQ